MNATYNERPQGSTNARMTATEVCAIDKPPTQIECELRQLEGQLNILGESWSKHCDVISPVVQPYPGTPVKEEKEPTNRCPLADRLRRMNIQFSLIISNIQQTTKQVEL